MDLEISESKKIIEQKLQVDITCFAYPHGAETDFSDEVISSLKKSGYQCAVTNIRGINRLGDDLFRLKRIGIYGHESFATFICRCFNIF